MLSPYPKQEELHIHPRARQAVVARPALDAGEWRMDIELRLAPPREITYDPATGHVSITASGGDSHLFGESIPSMFPEQ